MKNWIRRAGMALILLLLFTAPASAQGTCRLAAPDIAVMLDEARAALAAGDTERADGLIAEARGALAENCRDVPPAPSEATAAPDPEATAAPTGAAESAPPAGNFTIAAPELGAEESIVFLRFAHTGIDAGSLDFHVERLGDAPLVANLAFGEATGIIALPSGNHTIIARPAGGGEALSTLNWDFTGNSTWVVTASGLQSTFAFIVEPMTIIRTPLGGKSRVRVANWVAGAERLSVNSDEGANFGDGLGWVGIKDSEIEPGTHTLRITGESGNEYGEARAFDFAPDTVYTLLLVGNKDGDPAVGFLVLETPQDQSRVRFVNNRGDAVDIHVRPGNALLAADVQPEAETDWFALPSAATTFIAYAPGTGPTGQEKAAIPLQMRPGRDITIVLRPNGAMEVRGTALTPVE